MLASPIFVRSQRLSLLLRYTVEEALAGKSGSLKETVIAAELYRKGSDFDPSSDATVRVDARRLRDKLREYYAEHAADPVLIALPKGTYTPVFETREPPAPRPVDQRGRPRLPLLGLAVLFSLAAGAVIIAVQPGRAGRPFEQVSIRRLSRSGNLVSAALSPDGKYAAFVTGDIGGPSPSGGLGKESLHIRSVESPADIELIPRGPQHFSGVAFSPDGSEIDFVVRLAQENSSTLRRVGIRGGPVRIIARSVDSPPTRSPDGSRLAFVREDAAGGESALIVASRDGGEQRRIAGVRLPDYLDYPAWAQDGSVIACTLVRPREQQQTSLVFIDPRTGSMKTVSPFRWRFLRGISWSSDNAFLVAAGRLRESPLHRVWMVEKATGRVTPITGENDDIHRVHMAGRARRMLGIQRWRTYRVMVTQSRKTGEPVAHEWTSALTNAFAGARGSRVIAWTPDGRIITEAQDQLFVSQPDGSGSRQLTSAGSNKRPSVCADGRWVYYKSDGATVGEVWRTPLAGGSPEKMVLDSQEGGPLCGSSSEWFYTAALLPTGWAALYRAGADGGPPVRMSQGTASVPAISRDGRRLAYLTAPTKSGQGRMDAIEVIAADDGRLLHRFPLAVPIDAQVELRWTPDGGGVAYAAHHDGMANIWVQPLDGGPPRQVTHLQTSRIFAFDWAWDGSRLGVSVGSEPNDMVLLEESPPIR